MEKAVFSTEPNRQWNFYSVKLFAFRHSCLIVVLEWFVQEEKVPGYFKWLPFFIRPIALKVAMSVLREDYKFFESNQIQHAQYGRLLFLYTLCLFLGMQEELNW